MSAAPLVIEPKRPYAIALVELWRYRELLLFFAWRDIIVRYKQTYLGFAWALLRPLASAGLLTLVFGMLAKTKESGSATFPLLVLAGWLPFQVFSQASGSGLGSITGNGGMIGKVYFPRTLLPLASCTVAVVDGLIGLLLLLTLAAWYGTLTWAGACLAFIAIGIAALFGLGLSLAFASLSIRYRDAAGLFPYAMQLLAFVTPIGFSPEAIDPRAAIVVALNPLSLPIAIARHLAGQPLFATDVAMLLTSGLCGLALVAGGLGLFLKVERTMADHL